jgi:hypothetical protein
MLEIEVLRAGSFTAMGGDPVEITAADLDALAAGYEPALHEAPVVVGHPAADAPAYGWVRGLRVRDDRLVADIDQLDPAFGELVRAGRYKKVSASLYRPGSSSPKPGAWYLRHVGFLGAQPPAVKGLKSIALGDDGEGVVTVALGEPAPLSPGPGAGAGDDAKPPCAEPPRRETGDPMPDPITAPPEAAAELAEREAAIAARDVELAERQAAIAAREAAMRRRELEAEAEGFIAEGRVLPAERAAVVGLMAALDGEATVELGEGEAEPAGAVLRRFLAALPARVAFGEKAKDERADQVDPADAVRLAEAANALIAAEAAKGIALDIATAVRRVAKGATP